MEHKTKYNSISSGHHTEGWTKDKLGRWNKEAKSKALEGMKKESLIERHNRQVAKRDAGKTKEQMSGEAFKSGRTSGRY